MTQLGEMYKCSVCGNTVEVLNPGMGKLVCCGQPMEIKQPEVKEEITRQEEPAKDQPQEEAPII